MILSHETECRIDEMYKFWSKISGIITTVAFLISIFTNWHTIILFRIGLIKTIHFKE